MKDELLIIGNYKIEVSYYGASWVANVKNAHREILTFGQTREEAVNEAMRIVRATQPHHGSLDHLNATEKLRLSTGFNNFGEGFSRVFGVR